VSETPHEPRRFSIAWLIYGLSVGLVPLLWCADRFFIPVWPPQESLFDTYVLLPLLLLCFVGSITAPILGGWRLSLIEKFWLLVAAVAGFFLSNIVGMLVDMFVFGFRF
jgi:hypothetical protein